MKVTTLSSRDFTRNIRRAKRAADDGPVIITDRGKPAYVLLRHDDYRRLAGDVRAIGELRSSDLAFGLWGKRAGDGLARQRKLRAITTRP